MLNKNAINQLTIAKFMLCSIVMMCCFSARATTTNNVIKPPPLVSIPTHDAFFRNIKKHCGKAFKGKLVVDEPGNNFPKENIIMHVRKCSNTEIQIPFHVGDDASRTWIISKTGAGLMLKHDHRKSDGSYEKSTMYGGHTIDSGFNEIQSFPADTYSKQLFVTRFSPESMENIWQISIYPESFSYRLSRPARYFQVDFDLTNVVEAPPAPWGYKDQ